MSAAILIVDDEPVQRRLLENSVNKMGYRAVVANDGAAALEILQGPGGAGISLVVLDLVMPEMDGMEVLARMNEIGITKPVIVQTARGSIETVVSAMRSGASDFCVKPVSFERLKVSISNGLKLDAMEDVVKKVRKSADGVFTFKDMIADSEAMKKVIGLGDRAAASSIPILIEGESGVGKEVVAQAIQGASERRGKPFVTVNCGALPENLVESILFGHEKGAFTGASQSHRGKFKEADGGTLFLDEVGELPLDIQVKLLRAIQEGEVDPVGAKSPEKTDFRLISATNRDMITLVKEGLFREDLYYRLNVFPIHVPPLRQRKSDIAALVRHFTARICLEEGRRNISGIRADALATLEAYDWPGNIRQLENTIFRAVILCDGDELTLSEIPQVASALGDRVALPEDTVVSLSPPASGNDVIIESSPATQFGMMPMLSDHGDVRSLDEMERSMIEFAISHHRGRMTAVARSLGIGRSTLYRKLKELDINPNELDARENSQDLENIDKDVA